MFGGIKKIIMTLNVTNPSRNYLVILSIGENQHFPKLYFSQKMQLGTPIYMVTVQ